MSIARSSRTGTLPAWITGHPDTPPISGNAEDDEFESTTLNAKWTETLTGAPTRDIHTTQKSHYWVQFTTANQSFQITQPAPTGTGTFSMTAKVFLGLTPGGTFPQFLLLAKDAGGTNVVYTKLDLSGGVWRVSLLKQASGSFTDNGTTTIDPGTTHLYLHLQRLASNVWEGWASKDGRSWWRIASFTFSFTVDKIALEADFATSSQANGRCGVDWFRRDWLTL